MVEEAGGRVTTMVCLPGLRFLSALARPYMIFASVSMQDAIAYSVFDRSILATNESLHRAIQEKTESVTRELKREGFDLSPWFIPKGYNVRMGRI